MCVKKLMGEAMVVTWKRGLGVEVVVVRVLVGVVAMVVMVLVVLVVMMGGGAVEWWWWWCERGEVLTGPPRFQTARPWF